MKELSDQERLYGMNYRTHQSIGYKSKTISIGYRLTKLLRLLRLLAVFSLLSQIGRTSTDEGFMKEPSDRDDCMG